MSEIRPPIGAYQLMRDDRSTVIYLFEELPSESDVLFFMKVGRANPDLSDIVGVRLIRQWDDEESFAAWCDTLPEHSLAGWNGIETIPSGMEIHADRRSTGSGETLH